MFAITMDTYTHNTKTKSRDRFVKRVYKEFDSAEKLSVFWEKNKKITKKK